MTEKPANWINPHKPTTLEEFKKVYEHELSTESVRLGDYRALLWMLIELDYTKDYITRCFLQLDIAQRIELVCKDCHRLEPYITGDDESAEDLKRGMQPVKWLESILDYTTQRILKQVNSYIAGFVDPSCSKADRESPCFSQSDKDDIIRDIEKHYFEIVKPERERAQLDRETLEKEKERFKKERETLEKEKKDLQNELRALEYKKKLLQAEIEAKATALKQTDTAPESTSKAPAKTKEKKPIKVTISKVPNSFHPELTAKAKLLYGRLLILTSFAYKQCVYTNQQAQKELHFGPRSTNRYFKELRDAKLLTTTNISDHPNAQSINVRMVELSIEAMPPKRAKS